MNVAMQTKLMLKMDKIKSLGKKAKEDFKRLCQEKNIEHDIYMLMREYTEEHFEVCEAVYKLWHTTNNFKVGDKVYIVPTDFTHFEYCIRATVTEIDPDKWGYHLRAFEKDLPAIYIFNQWDKDLAPRTDKSNKRVPEEFLMK